MGELHLTPQPGDESGPISVEGNSQQQEVPSLFSEFDLYLFGQGKHYDLYEKMGAHPRVVDGVAGVNFAVWAPNALAVSVIGDFNNWDRGATPMQLRHHDFVVWECFVLVLGVGTFDKYA